MLVCTFAHWKKYTLQLWRMRWFFVQWWNILFKKWWRQRFVLVKYVTITADLLHKAVINLYFFAENICTYLAHCDSISPCETYEKPAH